MENQGLENLNKIINHLNSDQALLANLSKLLLCLAGQSGFSHIRNSAEPSFFILVDWPQDGQVSGICILSVLSKSS